MLQAFELEHGVFEGLLSGCNAVFGSGFELDALVLEERVVELQRAATMKISDACRKWSMSAMRRSMAGKPVTHSLNLMGVEVNADINERLRKAVFFRCPAAAREFQAKYFAWCAVVCTPAL